MNREKFHRIITVMLLLFSLYILAFLGSSWDDSASTFMYDFSVCYVASYVFYLLINYFPEKFEEERLESEMVPLRYAIYRESFLLFVRMRDFVKMIYESYEKETGKKFLEEYTIKKMFDYKNMRIVAAHLNLYGKSPTILGLNGKDYMQWSEAIAAQLNDIYNRGEGIMNRYSGKLPSHIFNSIHFLIYDSFIVNKRTFITFMQYCMSLDKNIESGFSSMAECIPANEMNEDEIKALMNIFNWINDEAEYLSDKNTIYGKIIARLEEN